ncbi:MAG: ribosomal-processing cysteine protease Prp [Saccharofermentans sp.]|nr:ribosomal-processing cysteine protease Prp [Saccharofermentans sp.]
MITAIVDREGPDIKLISLSGHSGYAKSGSDIICAAASALIFASANGLEDICGYDNEDFFRVSGVDTNEVNASIKLPDTGSAEVRSAAQVIMRTLELGLISLAASYNDENNRFIEIINSKTPEV